MMPKNLEILKSFSLPTVTSTVRMMSKHVVTMKDEEQGKFTIDCAPGQVMNVFFAQEKAKIQPGRGGTAMEVKPVLFIDVDPKAEKGSRTFAFCDTDHEIPIIPGTMLEAVGVYVMPGNHVVSLYEIIDAPQ